MTRVIVDVLRCLDCGSCRETGVAGLVGVPPFHVDTMMSSSAREINEYLRELVNCCPCEAISMEERHGR